MEGLGYSKHANQKMLQVGKPHPDRGAQFAFINEKAKAITGKCQHCIPPDGVQYPRISMELVKVESSQDIPKEWKKPLVPEQDKP